MKKQNRRKFIKTAGIAAAGAIAFPYILPSGRLFAQTGHQYAKHVVYVLFAGGVRQQESVLQNYLDQSQEEPVEGNVMYNLLNGTPPPAKIVYGTTPSGQLDGSQPIPSILGNQTLESLGTYFPETRFSSGNTGHYYGLSTILTGRYATGQGLRQRPLYPTIFEYLRKHGNIPATKAWFIGNGIGSSTPLLNYSEHPAYGPKYGANFLAPEVTFSDQGEIHLANAKIYHPEEQLEPIYEMKKFLDQSLNLKAGTIPGIYNTDEEKQDIKNFIDHMFDKKAANQIAFPPVSDSGDLRTIGYACEVMKWFKPAISVVNMSSIDSCHTSFTSYLRALHRCDHAVGHLWNYIQTQVPEMANDTAIVVMPEHGRNLFANPILDQNNWVSYDHNSDQNSRRIFTLMAGPQIPSNLKVGSANMDINASNPIGDATDCVPTIAEILGLKNEVMSAGLLSPQAQSLFERI
ncbi:MAG: hypothetical protein EA412_02560 [Chitinophagaceae bacterium]|nr:MAG: hypothetical protein EA412_02560 [Chitinophagaceae bacterium]